MHEYAEFFMPFVVGAALGCGTVYALLKSRLKFYRYMIEQRLANINQRIANS